ncbi:hypothetical protein SNEBB_008006 [Seison nebaliae]|nr:hypothetical protein SNEBB_008006 [Seison nebaliae]
MHPIRNLVPVQDEDIVKNPILLLPPKQEQHYVKLKKYPNYENIYLPKIRRALGLNQNFRTRLDKIKVRLTQKHKLKKKTVLEIDKDFTGGARYNRSNTVDYQSLEKWGLFVNKYDPRITDVSIKNIKRYENVLVNEESKPRQNVPDAIVIIRNMMKDVPKVSEKVTLKTSLSMNDETMSAYSGMKPTGCKVTMYTRSIRVTRPSTRPTSTVSTDYESEYFDSYSPSYFYEPDYIRDLDNLIQNYQQNVKYLGQSLPNSFYYFLSSIILDHDTDKFYGWLRRITEFLLNYGMNIMSNTILYKLSRYFTKQLEIWYIYARTYYCFNYACCIDFLHILNSIGRIFFMTKNLRMLHTFKETQEYQLLNGLRKSFRLSDNQLNQYFENLGKLETIGTKQLAMFERNVPDEVVSKIKEIFDEFPHLSFSCVYPYGYHQSLIQVPSALRRKIFDIQPVASFPLTVITPGRFTLDLLEDQKRISLDYDEIVKQEEKFELPKLIKKLPELEDIFRRRYLQQRKLKKKHKKTRESEKFPKGKRKYHSSDAPNIFPITTRIIKSAYKYAETHDKHGNNQNENRKAAINPIIIGILSVVLIVGIISGLSLIVVTTMPNSDTEPTTTTITSTTVTVSTTSTTNITITTTLPNITESTSKIEEIGESEKRALKMNKDVGILQTTIHVFFDDIQRCNENKKNLEISLAISISNSIIEATSGNCFPESKNGSTFSISFVFVLDLKNVNAALFVGNNNNDELISVIGKGITDNLETIEILKKIDLKKMTASPIIQTSRNDVESTIKRFLLHQN